MEQTEKKIKQPLFGLGLKGSLTLLSVFAAGVLIGRAGISEHIRPFGPAYIAAAFLNSESVNPYVALAGVLGALCTSIYSLPNLPFAFSVVTLVAVFMIITQYSRIRLRYIASAAGILLAYIISTFAFKRLLMLNILTSVIELCLCVCMAYMLHIVIRLLFRRHNTVLTDAELVSLGFAAVLSVLGMGNINIAGVYLRDVSAMLIAMTAAYTGGACVGAAVAAAVGAAAIIGGADADFVLLVSVCSLVSGIFSSINRYVFALGFLLTSMVIGYYTNFAAFAVIPFFTTLVAAAAFAAMPSSIFKFISRYVNANALRTSDQRLNAERFSELTVGRLKEISAVFKNASLVISSVAERQSDGITYAIAAIPEAACKGCVLYGGCWDKDFAGTYELMQRLFTKYAKSGKLAERDLGQAFLKQCLHPDKVIREASSTFREHETNMRWTKKINESRNVLKEQLMGLSEVVEKLSGEVQTDLEIRTDIEDSTRRFLDDEGLSAHEVLAHVGPGGLCVTLSFKDSVPLERLEKNVRRAVSRACGIRMSRTGTRLNRGQYIAYYGEAKAIGLSTAVSALPRDGMAVSGDSHSVTSIKDGRYMLLISDGMGSGERAAGESASVVSLLEDFYGAGFRDEMVISSVNKLMMLGGGEDMFSTIDLCMIDLHTAKARFTKIGAPHSYIVKPDRVRRISAGALPMGILEEMKPSVTVTELEPGDIILMFSDGVAEAEIDSDDIYRTIIRASEGRGVKEIADALLALAAAARGHDRDDMTVIVSRVTRG